MKKLLISVCTFFMACLSMAHASNFDPSAVSLQDESHRLFVGGLPVSNTNDQNPTFAYDELVAVFNEKLTENLSEDFQLFVVGIQHEEANPIAEVEKTFFAENPSKGKFLSHTFCDAAWNKESFLKEVVDLVRETFAETADSFEHVIYVHSYPDAPQIAAFLGLDAAEKDLGEGTKDEEDAKREEDAGIIVSQR